MSYKHKVKRFRLSAVITVLSLSLSRGIFLKQFVKQYWQANSCDLVQRLLLPESRDNNRSYTILKIYRLNHHWTKTCSTDIMLNYYLHQLTLQILQSLVCLLVGGIMKYMYYKFIRIVLPLHLDTKIWNIQPFYLLTIESFNLFSYYTVNNGPEKLVMYA